jgi:hypothetical protein
VFLVATAGWLVVVATIGVLAIVGGFFAFLGWLIKSWWGDLGMVETLPIEHLRHETTRT